MSHQISEIQVNFTQLLLSNQRYRIATLRWLNLKHSIREEIGGLAVTLLKRFQGILP